MADSNRPKLPPLSIPMTSTDTWYAEAPLPLRVPSKTAPPAITIAAVAPISPAEQETYPTGSSPPFQYNPSNQPTYPPSAYDRYRDRDPELSAFRPSRFLEHIGEVEESAAESAAEAAAEQMWEDQGKYSTATTAANTSSQSRMTILTGRLSATTTFLAALRWSSSGPTSLRSGSTPSFSSTNYRNLDDPELAYSDSVYSRDETGHLAPPPDRRNTLQPESPYSSNSGDNSDGHLTPRPPTNQFTTTATTALLPLCRIPFSKAFIHPRAAPHPQPQLQLEGRSMALARLEGQQEHGPSPLIHIWDSEAGQRLLDRIHKTCAERRRKQLLQILAILALLGGIAIVSAAVMMAWEARGGVGKGKGGKKSAVNMK